LEAENTVRAKALAEFRPLYPSLKAGVWRGIDKMKHLLTPAFRLGMEKNKGIGL